MVVLSQYIQSRDDILYCMNLICYHIIMIVFFFPFQGQQ